MKPKSGKELRLEGVNGVNKKSGLHFQSITPLKKTSDLQSLLELRILLPAIGQLPLAVVSPITVPLAKAPRVPNLHQADGLPVVQLLLKAFHQGIRVIRLHAVLLPHLKRDGKWSVHGSNGS